MNGLLEKFERKTSDPKVATPVRRSWRLLMAAEDAETQESGKSSAAEEKEKDKDKDKEREKEKEKEKGMEKGKEKEREKERRRGTGGETSNVEDNVDGKSSKRKTFLSEYQFPDLSIGTILKSGEKNDASERDEMDGESIHNVIFSGNDIGDDYEEKTRLCSSETAVARGHDRFSQVESCPKSYSNPSAAPPVRIVEVEKVEQKALPADEFMIMQTPMVIRSHGIDVIIIYFLFRILLLFRCSAV